METLLDAELARRFCYWRGRSGRRYIHTRYDAANCPPLPGAIYVAVGRAPDGSRRALAVGRFPPFFEFLPTLPEGCAEVHAHLLASSDAEARMALEDLRTGLGVSEDIAPGPRAGGNASRLPIPALV